MEKDFVKACDAAARYLLAANAETGICLNGSNLDAAAGTTGFQAVTATNVAAQVQDNATRERVRWRNCTHDTVADALGRAGWHLVWVRGKRFLLLDAAEAARLRTAAEDKRVAKRAAQTARCAKQRALREAGPTAVVLVWYAAAKTSWRGPAKPRRFELPAAEAFAFALRSYEGGKARRIDIRDPDRSWDENGGWSWKRPAAPKA